MQKRGKKVSSNNDINVILKKHNLGIKLDIGCGENKQDGFIGMDVRPLKGVDIVHNLEKFPYPLPDESVSLVTASHLLEHINPASPDPKLVGLINLLKKKKLFSDKEVKEFIGEYDFFGTFVTMMDEIWRILKPGGEFVFSVPYAGSIGYWQDPTHINPMNESTLAYFDPLDRSGLWHIYKPKPWKIKVSAYSMHGVLEVVLVKRLIDKSYDQKK